MQTLSKPASRSSAFGADRRAFGRRKTALPGKLRAGNRSYDCIVRDVSEGGALLEMVGDPVNVSGWMRLSFEGYPEEIVCEPRHVNGPNLGVQFARLIVVPGRISPAAEAAAAEAAQQQPVADAPMLPASDLATRVNRHHKDPVIALPALLATWVDAQHNETNEPT